MNKASSRVRILNLMDDNCVGCEHRRVSNSIHCWTNCDIGKEINALGTYLGGTHVENKVRKRTTKDWDKLCKKSLKLKQEGMTYKAIAEKLGVNDASYISLQLKKRGMK
ncbi:TPA: hypothetical protein QCY19_003999 [Bacillus luti]|nr:hypothetical protein [Bacillus luti]